MIKLMLEKFLKEHPDNWEDILSDAPYCLTIRHDEGMVLFKYNQYESDMNQVICREARGIIFDEETLEPVCVPYFKFFNYGEELAAVIDWDTASVQEKVDGSLMKVFNYKGRWKLATNGNINAWKAHAGEEDTASSFGDLFVNAIGGFDALKEFRDALNPKYCYMLELVHPLSKVIISYEEPSVYLHGMRNMETLEELVPNCQLPHCKMPKKYNIHNLEDTLNLIKQLNDGKHEGVVVCDGYFNRIKMKTEEYLEKARIANRGPLTLKRFVNLYTNGLLDDYVAYAPESLPVIKRLLVRINNIEDSYLHINEFLEDGVKGLSRKEVVERVRSVADPWYFKWYMKFYDGQVKHPIDWMLGILPSSFLKLLKHYHVEEELYVR